MVSKTIRKGSNPLVSATKIEGIMSCYVSFYLGDLTAKTISSEDYRQTPCLFSFNERTDLGKCLSMSFKFDSPELMTEAKLKGMQDNVTELIQLKKKDKLYLTNKLAALSNKGQSIEEISSFYDTCMEEIQELEEDIFIATKILGILDVIETLMYHKCLITVSIG